ncbi:MAG: class I SAM-dependent methyltransferase [Bryobacteraceae bacterium]|nr:class I SAM-dependent methyltransferase [Bryobacteraceae bacterium]
MKLYSSLAEWWPLLSPHEEYVEEAGIYGQHLLSAGNQPSRTLVEFGSGGGNNAFYLKNQFTMTLVDASAGMLEVSRELNPDCEHFAGDMRTIRLGREFDRVFIHDAICYMTTAEDLRKAIETAFVHCRPGGGALFAPDFVSENFHASSDHGGTDGKANKGLRYLEWTWDPDPTDSTYTVDYVYLMRSEDGSTQVEHERHFEGLFSRSLWIEILTDVGFQPQVVPFEHSEIDSGTVELFVGVKPAS